MLDNKVSPSQERCWLSNRVQLLETKVTALWLWEGQESMARLWPTSENNKTYRLNQKNKMIIFTFSLHKENQKIVRTCNRIISGVNCMSTIKSIYWNVQIQSSYKYWKPFKLNIFKCHILHWKVFFGFRCIICSLKMAHLWLRDPLDLLMTTGYNRYNNIHAENWDSS